MLTFSTAVRAVSYFASYKLYYIIIRLYGWTGLKYKSILSVMKSLLMNSFLSFSSLFYDRSNALCTGIGIRPYTVGKFVFAGFFMILVHTGIWPQLIWQSFDFVCVCVWSIPHLLWTTMHMYEIQVKWRQNRKNYW